MSFRVPESDSVPIPNNLAQFNYPDDCQAWRSIFPITEGEPLKQDSKTYLNIKLWIEGEYPETPKLLKILRFVNRCLVDSDQTENGPVSVIRFIWMTKCFGPFRRNPRGNSCYFLEQIHNLLSYTLPMNNIRVSPFALFMKQEEAERRLLADNVPITSYLIRFSESRADEGGFCLSVKYTAAIVNHYHIIGRPSESIQRNNYDAQLRLQHIDNPEQNDDEESYRSIVHFMRDRLDDEIADGIYCDKVCPNLPHNALFRGYN